MKRMWRHRLTAWILSSVMAVSAIPVTVQAEPTEDGYTEEATVQEAESEASGAEGENALEESEQPKAGGQDEDEGTPENGAEIEYVETEIENAYQFGGAPTEREPAVYARARSNDAGIEDYLYQQIQGRVEEVALSAYNIAWSDAGRKSITNIIGGILNEHPELYFVGKEFVYSGLNDRVISVKITYNKTLDDTRFQLGVNKALSVVNAGMSDLEKAIALHDYIAVNCEYDKENYDKKSIPDISYTAYGVFVEKTAVCEGYALAYKYLLNKQGIDCYMVTSDSMNHAWNLIELDGKYYQVDVTWDDPTWDQLGRVRHWYMFRSDHAFKTITKQHANWQVTSGSTVVDYQATDVQYDNAFWTNCDSQMIITDNGCYYIYSSESSSGNAIKKASLSNVSGTNTTIVENVGVWRDWDSSDSYWPGAYSGLFLDNGRLYYNTPNEVRSVALDGSDGRPVFTPDTSTGYIYGIALRDGELAYCLHQSPNLSEKETILYSGIKIPADLPTDIPVTSITLDQNSLTLVKGDTADLQATVSPSDATDRTVAWSSSNSSVATVSDGRVTAVGAGNCTITASAGEKSASCNITVKAPYIMVTKTKTSYECGDTLHTDDLEVTYYDGTGASTEIPSGYTTNASSIDMSTPGTRTLTVTYNGLTASIELTVAERAGYTVTFDLQGHGNAFSEYANYKNIQKDSLIAEPTAPSEAGYLFKGWYKEASCITLWNFSVDIVTADTTLYAKWEQIIPVQSITLDKTSLILQPGSTASLSATVSPSNATYPTVIWSSSNEAVAVVKNGTVTAGEEGSCIITASAGEKSASCNVTVKAPYIVATKTKTSYECGDTLHTDDLEVTYYDGTGTSTKIMSGYTTNASSINMSTPGTRTLTVTYNGLMASIDLTVVEKASYTVTFDLQGHGNILSEYTNYKNIRKDSLIAEPSAPSEAGYLFKGWYKEASCITLWNFSVDTVTADTTLYAKWEQIIPVQNITLDKTSLILQPGSTASLSATVNPSNATYPTVIWSSSNEAVAAVNDGIVTAVGEGSCSIKATAGSKQVSCIVHVNTSGTADQIADGSYEGTVWKIDGSGKLTVEGTGNVRANHDSVETIPWYVYRDKILSAQVNVTGMTDAYQLFSGCYNLTEIDLSGFDSGSVTDMSYMFEDCSSLTELDLSKFDTGNVDSMYGMFSGCSSLTELDLSSFDTKNVTHMFSMFYNCSSLSELDLCSFSTENVVSMSTMFSGCKNLTNLDISSFNTKKVTGMAHMFTNCSNLNSLDLGSFNTEQVTNMFGMFWGCSSLAYLDISAFHTENVTDMRWMFSDCGRLVDLNVSHFNTGNVTYMSGMFYGCNRLAGLDVSHFDTGKVIDMSSMFCGCNSLTGLDVSHWNTENVTDMSWMFSGCGSLTELNTGGFNTEQVTGISGMFSNCGSLTELNVSNFHTEQVTGMNAMFSGCSSLTELNVSRFNTQNVETMESMFSGCSSLKALDLSSFDTKKVTNMGQMFWGCSGLAELDASNFHTENVENMSYMFSGCSGLKTLNVSGFNTCCLVNADDMFNLCENLEMLDLSSFDLENTKNATSMFWDCSSLVRIQTPVNVGLDIYLPFGDWYDEEGIPVTVLPQNMSSSVTIMKYTEPVITYPCITAIKVKTAYVCGETLNLDDLTVIYHADAENEKIITDFTTNASEIDMSEPGHKELKISYDGLTVNIPLMVRRETEYPVEDTYTVTFDLQDHGTVLPEYENYKNIKKGEQIQKPQDPKEEGYTFGGWYQDEACTIAWDFAEDKVEKDLTLYAKWEKDDEKPEAPVEDTCTITFDLQGHGTALAEYENYKNIKKGEQIQKPRDPKEEGYTFAGWYQDEACTIAWDFAEDKVEKDLTLYAKWEKVNEKPETPAEDTCTVTFDLQGHGTAPAEYRNYINIKKGEQIQKPQDPQESGYIFGGWYRDSACTVPWNFSEDKIENDITLYAKWTQEAKEEDLGEVLPADVPSDGIPEETLWEADIEDVQYTGKAMKPEVHIYWGKERLSEGVDYTLKYRNNVQANEDVDADKAPCVEIKYKKYYPGAENKSIPFKILPVDLDDVTADDIVVACTNKVQKKVPRVTWNGKKLSNKKDFSIDYPDEGMPGAYQDVGEYTITISEGRNGNFTGTKDVKLIVTDKVPVSKVSVRIPKQTYQKGTELRPDPIVKYKGKILEKDSDYTVEYENNTEVGTASALVIGTGDYIGVKRAAFKITGESLKKAKVEKIEPKEYDGSFQMPVCMVTYQGSILKEHVDYEVSYTNNRNTGKASVTLTGIGAYSGTVKKTFRIIAYDLKADEQKGAGKLVRGLEEEIEISRADFEKGICKPEPVLTYKGRVLRKGRDYSLSYKNNKKAVDANANKAPTIIIKGKGNFKGTLKKTFTITE